MQNVIQDGKVLTLTAPYDVVSGAGALVGSLFGVATAAVASAASGEFSVEGVFELAKTTSQAWSVGDKLYWNDSTKKLSTVATVGPLVGVCTEAALSADTTGVCKLTGVSELSEGNQGTVADVATADADGTYGAPEASLINELKTQLNALLAKLRIQGLIS